MLKKFPASLHLARHLARQGVATEVMEDKQRELRPLPKRSPQPRRVMVQPEPEPKPELEPTLPGSVAQAAGFQADESSFPPTSPSSPTRGCATPTWKRLSLARHAVNSIVTFRDEKTSEDMSTTVASSRKKSLHPRNWYFLMLEMSWPKLVVFLTAIYAVFCLLFAALTVPILHGITKGNDTTLDSTVALWFATSNIVMSSYTDYYYPEENHSGVFLMGTFQQFFGILLQAALFSVTVSRFQMPKPDFL